MIDSQAHSRGDAAIADFRQPHCTTVSQLSSHLSHEQSRFSAQLGNLRLDSAFQPIVGLCHERIIGHEALMRPSCEGVPTSPDWLLRTSTSLEDLIRLDRLGRLLHAINYSLSGERESWLFLNVHPQIITHGRQFGLFFDDMLAMSNLNPQRIVIEVLEGNIEDDSCLEEGVNYYRERGCLIALDDFGARHSNIDRVLRLHPDIVKFDKSLIRRAARDPQARRILAHLVALLHDAGIMSVIEGIETIEEALIALDADADFGQGYLFARPSLDPVASSIDFDFSMLNQRLQQHQQSVNVQCETLLQQTVDTFMAVIHRYTSGHSFQEIAPQALAGHIHRLYLLDGSGYEIDTVISPQLVGNMRHQLTPLLQTHRANWSRRPYFRAAINDPGKLHVTPPYHSTSDRQLCRTLSCAINTPQGEYILCADMVWQEV